MGKNNDAETGVRTSLLEAGRIRCGSEGRASSLVSRLKHKRAGSLFVCYFQNPKFFRALFLTFCLWLYTDAPPPLHSGSKSPSTNQTSLEQIQRSFNKNKSSLSNSLRLGARTQARRGRRCCSACFCFSQNERRRLSLQEEVAGKEKEKRRQDLTKYGQYAEQDGDEGMDAHSHPPSAALTLRAKPPLITLTRLKQLHKRN